MTVINCIQNYVLFNVPHNGIVMISFQFKDWSLIWNHFIKTTITTYEHDSKCQYFAVSILLSYPFEIRVLVSSSVPLYQYHSSWLADSSHMGEQSMKNSLYLLQNARNEIKQSEQKKRFYFHRTFLFYLGIFFNFFFSFLLLLTCKR